MMRQVLSCCLLFCAVFAAWPAAAQPLALSMEAIEHPSFSARQIALRLNGLSGGSAELEVGRLALAGHVFKHVHLRCGEFRWSPQRIECRHGELRPATAPALPLSFSYVPQQQRLEIDIGESGLASVAVLFPELVAWHPGGRFAARLSLDAAHADLALQLRGAAFADTEGKYAGEKIEATLDAKFAKQASGWNWQASINWPHGEAYVAPLYRAGGMRFAGAGKIRSDLWSVEKGELTLDGVGSASGTLQWQPAVGKLLGKLRSARVESGALELDALVKQFVQPFLDQQAGAKLTASGKARISIALDDKGIERADVAIVAGSIAGGTFALQGIDAKIPWRRETETHALFHAAGGRFGNLPLGVIDLPLVMRGFDVSLPRTEIPLLDGQILLEDFHAARSKGEGGKDAWQWQLSGALHPISMPLLTQALGLPKMDGILSALIPSIRYADQTLALDGTLMISLFDGYMSASGLKVVEPFGVLPRVQANVEARHLDLGMLTHTFSFGDITGYIDADVKGLEMSGMRPLAFDTHIQSSSGDYRKRISQRAVQNISSLGGAGAGAAIQRSFLHFFDTFGYDKIGVSCRLVNEVCEMGGVEAAAQGYVLIKGGGLPSLNVIGYNRRVHWDLLVSRLQAVIDGNSKIEIR